MRRNSFNVLFYVKKAKLRKNGEAPVMIRITVNGIRTESFIKRTIPTRLWDVATESSKGRGEQSVELNEYIRQLRFKVYSIHRELETSGKYFTSKLIMDMLYSVEEKQTFLSFFKAHINEITKLIGIDYVPITVTRYRNCYKYIEHVIKSVYKKDDMSFKEVSQDLIRQFEIYLKTDRLCQQNTVVRYMKCLKKITNKAIGNGLLSRDPFNGLKFAQKEVTKDILSMEELQLIINKIFKSQRLEYVRDVFVFCCYTGLAYVDVNSLTTDHLHRDNTGDLWIIKNRQKTDQVCNIPLLPIPLRILDKYKENPYCLKKGALLPVTSNQKMNSYLKETADILERESKRA